MKNRFLVLTLSVCFLCVGMFFAPKADAATETLHEPTKEEIVQMYNGALKYNFTQTSVWTNNYSLTAPYAAGTLKQESLDNALNYLNFNRYVAGLSYDVELNEEYNELAQHAALINEFWINAGYQLSHHPSKPGDMSDEFYAKAYEGSSTSNLGEDSVTLTEFIYGCMMDGQDNNLNMVGHRSWFLRPHVEEMGIGDVGWTSAAVVMKTGDDSVPYDYVAWPPKTMPMELMNLRDQFKGEDGEWAYRYPFSIMLGDEYQSVDNESSVTVTVKYKGKTYTLNTSDKDKNGEYFAVGTVPFSGSSKVIIFDIPEMIEDIYAEVEGTDIDANDRVDITISGDGIRKWNASTNQYENATIHHTVDFFYIDKANITELGVPTLTKVKYDDKTKTAVYWEPITGATSYKVEYKVNSGSWQTYTGSITDKDVSGETMKWISVGGLEQGKTYYFRVTAVRDSNPSRNRTSGTISYSVPASEGSTTQPDTSITPKPDTSCRHELVSNKITKATTTADGNIDKVCSLCGETTTSYKIAKASNISLSFTSAEYTGAAISPVVNVQDSSGKTLATSNYTVSTPSGRVQPGTYTYTVTLKGNYEGSQTLTLTIAPKTSTVTPTPDVTPAPDDATPEKTPVAAKVKSVKLAKTSVVYTGKAQKVKVTAKDTKGKTIAAKYYTVTYKNNKAIGKATVTVKFKGQYSGTKKLTFKIVPKAPSIKKPAAAKKAVTVKWAKGKKAQVTGYEVMAATNKKFTAGKKTIKVKNWSKTSAKLTKLKAKKTYYVKVRTYKTVKGVKYYSAWSSVKKVKTK